MKDLAIFGDSVHWGQGLLPGQKFTQIVADAIGLHPRMEAHSGAIVGVGSGCSGAAPSEVPLDCPTILQQVLAYHANPADVVVVLVNGGVNDVTVQNIINPLVPPDRIRRMAQKYCHLEMAQLLAVILQKFSGTTSIVLTSYFPIFSRASDFDEVGNYLAANFIVVPKAPELAAQRQLILERVVENAQTFWQSSTEALMQAVGDVGPRVRFAFVPYADDNAMFAPDAWLWEVHLRGGVLVPEDPVAKERRIECDAFHPLPLDRAACYIASAGHPNLKGAKVFADTVLAVLKTSPRLHEYTTGQAR